MNYINENRMNDIVLNKSQFTDNTLFQWLTLENFLTDSGYRNLIENPVSLDEYYESQIQNETDLNIYEYFLDYQQKNPQIPNQWLEFISELDSAQYKQFIYDMFDIDYFIASYQWQVWTKSSYLGPSIGHTKRIGAHQFNLNTTTDWDSADGGEIMVLTDRDTIRDVPYFEDFNTSISTGVLNDNKSFLYKRSEHSWYGIPQLTCANETRLRYFSIIMLNEELD